MLYKVSNPTTSSFKKIFAGFLDFARNNFLIVENKFSGWLQTRLLLKEYMRFWCTIKKKFFFSTLAETLMLVNWQWFLDCFSKFGETKKYQVIGDYNLLQSINGSVMTGLDWETKGLSWNAESDCFLVPCLVLNILLSLIQQTTWWYFRLFYTK